ncbi:MAG: TatD family hydrolase [Sphingomonadaceae bacterium]|nr:TatD family hydrolase [Sphingomonadaceae bacterium]
MLVDSHCHLDYPGLAEEQAAVLARARAAGVAAMVNISTRETDWARVAATAEAHGDVFASIGVHPHEADGHAHVTEQTLIDAASHPKVVGLGETGLDYHYDHSDRAAQQRSFRAHIEAARMTQLPLIIHTRDAEDDTAAILADELARGRFPFVIHCFTGTRPFAERMLELGGLISLSGIVTFRKSTDLQATAATLPLGSLLVETDAPFLAPHPHRGTTCEPAHVAITAAFVAELRGISDAALAAATTDNFDRLFTKARA